MTRSMNVADLSRGDLPPMPIEPTWIIEGNPVASGVVLTQSPDKLLSSGLWSCTAGRFRWTFGWDEFVHILEGEVTIRDETGQTRTLTAGQTAFFPLGLNTEWSIPQFVRKVFTVRTKEPLSL